MGSWPSGSRQQTVNLPGIPPERWFKSITTHQFLERCRRGLSEWFAKPSRDDRREFESHSLRQNKNMNIYRSPKGELVYLRLVRPPKYTGGEFLEAENIYNGRIESWSLNKKSKFELIAYK